MFGFKKINNISPAALQERLYAKDTLVIDVREPSEYRGGHLPNAKNVPLGRITTYTPPANKNVYVICQSGARSKRAYRALAKRGIDVTNVQGGMMAWQGRTV